MADDLQDLMVQRKLAELQQSGAVPQDAVVGPMGPFGKMLAAVKQRMTGGQVDATTDRLTGNISYDPRLERTPQAIEQMLVHEGRHAQQVHNRPILDRIIGLFGPEPDYGQQSNELEAYQAENDYDVAHGRSPGQNPNFYGPDQNGIANRIQGDFYLPPAVRKR